MCGAPKQGAGLDGIDLRKQTVIQGQVWHDGAPVAGAYVRLLDTTERVLNYKVRQLSIDYQRFKV